MRIRLSLKETPNHEVNLNMRLTRAEKEAFELAAALANVKLSEWARERMRAASAMELDSANLPVPFLIPEDDFDAVAAAVAAMNDAWKDVREERAKAGAVVPQGKEEFGLYDGIPRRGRGFRVRG